MGNHPTSFNITIITPCRRIQNLSMLYESIQFDKINKWIIVYDTTLTSYSHIFSNHSQIVEVDYKSNTDDNVCCGNIQRNYGLSLVDDNNYVYFLDDDNIIHPDFWKIIQQLEENTIHTFNQYRDTHGNILLGNRIEMNHIDSAMYIVHKNMIGNIKWQEDLYSADGKFISDIYLTGKYKHKYFDNYYCYYNYIN
jgi:hypothetical protein